MVYVPADLLDEQIIQASYGRHFGKFPILSYLHHRTKATLWRSSELLFSTLQNRNSDDEYFLKSISKNINGKSDLIIMSARA